ncbi:hypothetical protein FBZ94_103607 [Bradyrhizobium sacchari]|uniref:Collagen triple helix repeat protein n=1 Tax=Bradyrhizobium sacchari TaxID=1399419 RepID=A0A560JYJ4_9BRAD|nr:hypothetical protein FBZ94_103607 [Bradyrhizobium sacchari]TWB76162.1 hypothetical protein FBZ95_104343 [Bradyrhizobium sacchari]
MRLGSLVFFRLMPLALVIFTCSAPSADPQSCIPDVGCFSAEAKVNIPKIKITFSKDAELTLDTLSLADGAIIEIGTAHLKLRVRDLKIEGRATIRTFDPGFVPQKPATAPTGEPGTSYNPGPATEGRCPACVGRPGGNGADGYAGTQGVAGQKGGYVTLQISEAMIGELSIDTRGQDGGPGGDGGNGGAGGVGEQGGRAQSGVLDCSTGPGYGGRGGAGGDGGRGGGGGNGGDGGVIVLQVPLAARPLIKATSEGGLGGEDGLPGHGGLGGEGGFGGRGDRLCQGREIDRKGERGVDGRPSPKSDILSLTHGKGLDGRPGTLIEL